MFNISSANEEPYCHITNWDLLHKNVHPCFFFWMPRGVFHQRCQSITEIFPRLNFQNQNCANVDCELKTLPWKIQSKNTLLLKWQAVTRQDRLPLCLFCKTCKAEYHVVAVSPNSLNITLAIGTRCGHRPTTKKKDELKNDGGKKINQKWLKSKDKEGKKTRRKKKKIRRNPQKKPTDVRFATNDFETWKNSSLTRPGKASSCRVLEILAWKKMEKKSQANSDSEVLEIEVKHHHHQLKHFTFELIPCSCYSITCCLLWDWKKKCTKSDCKISANPTHQNGWKLSGTKSLRNGSESTQKFQSLKLTSTILTSIVHIVYFMYKDAL